MSCVVKAPCFGHSKSVERSQNARIEVLRKNKQIRCFPGNVSFITIEEQTPVARGVLGDTPGE